MKKIKNILFTFLVILIGCNFIDPTKEAEKLLGNQVVEDSEGYLKLVSFVKTDGVKKNIDGVETYELSYKSVVECMKDGGWLMLMANDKKSLESYDMLSNSLAKLYFDQTKLSKVGEKYNRDGTMVLEKHESKWVIKMLN